MHLTGKFSANNEKYDSIVQIMEKYSRGWRGAPAKGVGRLRGARVQIPLSPSCFLLWYIQYFNKYFLKILNFANN